MSRGLRLSIQIAAAGALAALTSVPALAQGGPPQATLSSLRPAGPNALQVTGSVLMNGSDTTIVLQYGTAASLGHSTQPVDLGNCGTCGPVPVEQPVLGLTADTHYYVRIAATNASGTAYSQTLAAWTPKTSGAPGGRSTAPRAPKPAAASHELVGAVLGREGFSIAGVAGASCVTTSFCFAVGSGAVVHGPTSLPHDTALVWRYGGRSWRLATRIPLAQSSLAAVSCVSPSFCLAVGRVGQPASSVLALRWNGRSWSQVPADSPPSSGNGDALGSVDCLSRADCWAVGGINLGEVAGGVRHDLVEHWNGSRLSAVAAPGSGNPLAAMACAGAHACWATTYPAGAQLRSTNEVEQFNGRTWRVARLPLALSGGASGISCGTAAACWLVGMRNGNGLRPFALHLVDGAWRSVAMPTPQYPDVTLQGLACASAGACWAVGGNELVGPGIKAPSKSTPFAELWDGSAWQIARVTNDRYGYLAAAACLPGGFCVAGGQTSSGGALLAVSR